MDTKEVEILELARRRITDSIIVMKSLNESVLKLEKTIVGLDSKDEKLQKRIFWLTVVGVVLAGLQVMEAVKIVVDWVFKAKII